MIRYSSARSGSEAHEGSPATCELHGNGQRRIVGAEHVETIDLVVERRLLALVLSGSR